MIFASSQSAIILLLQGRGGSSQHISLEKYHNPTEVISIILLAVSPFEILLTTDEAHFMGA